MWEDFIHAGDELGPVVDEEVDFHALVDEDIVDEGEERLVFVDAK